MNNASDPLAKAFVEVDKLRARAGQFLLGGMITWVAANIMVASTAHIEKGSEAFLWIMVAIAGCFGIFILVDSYVRRHTRSKILPLVVKTLGLKYGESAVNVDALTSIRALPKAFGTHTQDQISGIIAGLGIDIIEVNIQTGDENTKILFHGLVLKISVKSGLPRSLFMPQKNLPKLDLFGKFDHVREQYEFHEMRKSKESDKSPKTDLLAFSDEKNLSFLNTKIQVISQQLEGKDRLHGLLIEPDHVVVLIDRRKDSFPVGGLLSSTKQQKEHLTTSFADLEMLVRLVSLFPPAAS